MSKEDLKGFIAIGILPLVVFTLCLPLSIFGKASIGEIMAAVFLPFLILISGVFLFSQITSKRSLIWSGGATILGVYDSIIKLQDFFNPPMDIKTIVSWHFYVLRVLIALNIAVWLISFFKRQMKYQ